MKADKSNLLRTLPSISALLEQPEVIGWLKELPRSAVVAALQQTVESKRREILDGCVQDEVRAEAIIGDAEAVLRRLFVPSLRRVVNATGIILHTGLGRAPLPPTALEALVDGARGYCNLELDLESGERGNRASHIVHHVRALTGAESATVVNNNAAATMLILNELAFGKEVVVSRGQLIEIGGSFRLPDIMRASGAVLREVGTTNRTRISDYERAIGPDTSLLMRVHTSNFRIVGFTEEVEIGELAGLARKRGLTVVDDLGSGCLIDLRPFGLEGEPRVSKSIAEGADLACFSGDKLLGGPQCGIIIGRRELIERLERNPLMRAFRVDRLTLLALEAVLRCYRDEERAFEDVPALKMLTVRVESLAVRADELCRRLEQAAPGEQFRVCSDLAYAGGGALPTQQLETVVIKWTPRSQSPAAASKNLRLGLVPVIARVTHDAISFDLRTIADSDFELICSGVRSAIE